MLMLYKLLYMLLSNYIKIIGGTFILEYQSENELEEDVCIVLITAYYVN